MIATFGYATSLHTIDKLILAQDGSQTFTSTFSTMIALENIEIEGTIGKNGFSLSQSQKLSKKSLISVVEHLSTTTSGLSVSLSKNAVNKAFETSVGANDGTTSTEWLALIGKKSNWTISLG